MGVLTPQQKQKQRAHVADLMGAGKGLSKPNRALLLPLTSRCCMDEQAVARVPQAHERNLQPMFAATAVTSGFGHDFSRIPIHAAVSKLEQDKRVSGGDEETLRANGITCAAAGKPAAPLADEGEWPEMSGNGVPENAPDEAVPADAGTPAATPPKLTKKTVSGPTERNCGGFKWVIQWELDKKTTKGGWVVQKVESPFDVKDCDNKSVDEAKLPWKSSWYPFWEAWQINKNQQVTTYAEGGDVKDDTYASSGGGDGTKGTRAINGTAEFYDGLTLPSSFKVTNKAPSFILPATTTAPTLSGGTGSLAHNLKATWDCCSTGEGTTKKTKVETT